MYEKEYIYNKILIISANMNRTWKEEEEHSKFNLFFSRLSSTKYEILNLIYKIETASVYNSFLISCS